MSLQHAKALRKQMTDAEQRLWYFLRARRFRGFKFKRQMPIGSYIVDFVSFTYRIIIEVDGGQHADNAGDRARDRWLASQGFAVLRFWNNDVLKSTTGVLEEIGRALDRAVANPPLPPHSRLRARSAPSPARGEGTGASGATIAK
jgi:very-short-patch-repair endonuclease